MKIKEGKIKRGKSLSPVMSGDKETGEDGKSVRSALLAGEFGDFHFDKISWRRGYELV